MYGCDNNEQKMAIIDVMIDNKYINHTDMEVFCKKRGLPIAPILYTGVYDYNIIYELANSKSSFLNTETKPIEGIVVKPIKESRGYMGRMIFKWISDKFWLNKENSEWK